MLCALGHCYAKTGLGPFVTVRQIAILKYTTTFYTLVCFQLGITVASLSIVYNANMAKAYIHN